MKKALAILIITLLVSAQIMPYLSVKADTVDLSTLQSEIQDIDTLVASDQQLFKQSLGLATALSMRQTGYEAPETSAIEDIGNWVWDRIHDIGDGTREVAQWVVDRLSDIIDDMHPHSSGGHRFSYNPTDAPLYNALYTDDDWNSLVSSWSQATSHNDNFISFDDITDDVEGWADKYYEALYPDGMNGNPAYDITGMSVSLRSQIVSCKPIVVGLLSGQYNGTTKKFIYRANYKQTAYCTKVVYEQASSLYWYPYFYWSDGTKTQSWNKTQGYSGTIYTNRNVPATGNVPQHYEWYWSENTTITTASSNYPSAFQGVWNESIASQNVYNWYHTNSMNGVGRVCNLYFYYLDPSDNTEKPFSVHPNSLPDEWDAPTQTPIIINNTRSYISVTNNTTITDYTTVYNNVTNNNIDNSTVIQNIFNQNTIYYVLPAPTYIESPQPTPEPITPIPTASPTPTDGPVDPSLTPTPINVQPIIPWPTGLPITPPPESDIPVPGSEVNPIPSDIPSMNIDIPSLASLTSDGQIQNTVLVNDEGNDVDNDDIVQDLFDVIPGEDDRYNLQLILFGLLFVGIVVTYLTK